MKPCTENKFIEIIYIMKSVQNKWLQEMLSFDYLQIIQKQFGRNI